jgi:hypothetical protein
MPTTSSSSSPLGAYKLRDELTAQRVQAVLRAIGKEQTTRSVALVKDTLERAIRLAQAHDKVTRNVTEVVKTPAGQKERGARQAFSLQEMLGVLMPPLVTGTWTPGRPRR